jgi:hypothetical protein
MVVFVIAFSQWIFLQQLKASVLFAAYALRQSRSPTRNRRFFHFIDELTMSGADDKDAQGGSLLLNQPVIFDNGSSTIKAGFAGSLKPKVG